MKKYILLGLVLILYNCNKPPQTEGKIIVNVEKKQTKSIHNIFKYVKYIKLETIKESIIGHISKVIVYKNNIYIHDNRSPSNVLIFNVEGKYQSKITRHGKGPGESMGILDFNIDNDSIYLFDPTLQKMMVCSLTGELIREKKVPFKMLNFEILKNGDLFAIKERPGNDSKNNKFNKLFLLSLDKNKILKEFHIEPVIDDINLRLDKVFYSNANDNKILYWEFFNNIIYEFSGNNISKKYEVNFGKHNLGADILKLPFLERFSKLKGNDYAGIINNIIEDTDQLFFSFVHNEKNYTVIYNKVSKEANVFSLEDEKENIENIILFTKTGNFYVSVIDPGKLDKKNILFSEIDNPILILCK
jgi:hypothetical protein